MDPAFSSMPPPGPDDGVKPMTFVAATMWATGAQLAFLWVLVLVTSMEEGASYDLVGRVLCQAVGYLLTLYLVLRFHGPEMPIRDFVALRSTHFGFHPLAIIVGLGATFPTYWLLGRIHDVFPPPERLVEWTDVFYQLSLPEQIAVAVLTIAGGPLVEELLFRGALFRPLRESYNAPTVVFVTGLLFAAVHLDPHRLLPLFVMGLILGYVRWASGSIVPPLLLHMGFNSVPFIDLFRYDAPPSEDVPDELGLALIAAGTVAVIIGLGLMQLLAKRSRAASGARREDG